MYHGEVEHGEHSVVYDKGTRRVVDGSIREKKVGEAEFFCVKRI